MNLRSNFGRRKAVSGFDLGKNFASPSLLYKMVQQEEPRCAYGGPDHSTLDGRRYLHRMAQVGTTSSLSNEQNKDFAGMSDLRDRKDELHILRMQEREFPSFYFRRDDIPRLRW